MPIALTGRWAQRSDQARQVCRGAASTVSGDPPTLLPMSRLLLVSAVAFLLASACDTSQSAPAPGAGDPPACQSITSVAAPQASIPAAPPVALAGDREAFGAALIVTLNPILIGSAVDDAVAKLRAAGWTVTIGQRTTTPTTATPDARWDRLVVWSCDGLVAEVSFD